jgi:hypothetical protein
VPLAGGLPVEFGELNQSQEKAKLFGKNSTNLGPIRHGPSRFALCLKVAFTQLKMG